MGVVCITKLNLDYLELTPSQWVTMERAETCAAAAMNKAVKLRSSSWMKVCAEATKKSGRRRTRCSRVETGISSLGQPRVHPNEAVKVVKCRFDNREAVQCATLFSCCLRIRIFTKLAGKASGKGDRCKQRVLARCTLQVQRAARKRRKGLAGSFKLVIALKTLNFDWKACRGFDCATMLIVDDPKLSSKQQWTRQKACRRWQLSDSNDHRNSKFLC